MSISLWLRKSQFFSPDIKSEWILCFIFIVTFLVLLFFLFILHFYWQKVPKHVVVHARGIFTDSIFFGCLLDSLKYTSALSVGLAIVFVVITAGVAILKLMNGSIGMPRLLPQLDDQASFWKLFTTVPILVTAYICHHNSKFETQTPAFFGFVNHTPHCWA